MARKHRTVPRPPSRKRKTSGRPIPPRPRGEAQRIAVRRLSAMKYRLAGATYRVIAEKLTEERAQAYADANDTSIDRAMKQIQPVSIWSSCHQRAIAAPVGAEDPPRVDDHPREVQGWHPRAWAGAGPAGEPSARS